MQTGQKTCYDSTGREIPCIGSGQDAELAKGISWPAPRFQENGETVIDLLTGLTWLQNANSAEFPMDWQAALDFIDQMNRDHANKASDWRLPDRRELRSLVSYQTKNPSLPENHPFSNVFPGWYWTSTTAAVNPDFSWCVHMGGGRIFYGAKIQYYLIWPVRGDAKETILCTSPIPRFEVEEGSVAVVDHMTGLRWRRSANLILEPVVWEHALKIIKNLNDKETDCHVWRLPNINELESLVDLTQHKPALPFGHPFKDCREIYWSSTTSMYEPDWAWALYMNKGAVGVGRKEYARFHVWAVCDMPLECP